MEWNRCFECGNPRIGAFKDHIKAEMTKKVVDDVGKVAKFQRMSMQTGCKFDDILDKYNIEQQCCRSHIIAETSFHKMLYEG